MTETNGLRLEWLDPNELRENPHQWRSHPTNQVEALKAALDEVGWAGALLYNERTGNLIDGHGRKSITEGKGEKVPVLVGSWTEEQERKILATLDPLASLAECDTAKLEALLAEVATDNEALREMLNDLAAENDITLPGSEAEPLVEPEAQIDRAAELLEKWQVKRGDLYAIRSNWCKCPKCGKVQKVQA